MLFSSTSHANPFGCASFVLRWDGCGKLSRCHLTHITWVISRVKVLVQDPCLAVRVTQPMIPQGGRADGPVERFDKVCYALPAQGVQVGSGHCGSGAQSVSLLCD